MIKNKVKIVIQVLFVFQLCACTERKTLDRFGYLAYFNSDKNILLKEKKINNIIYKLKMQLPEYIILKSNETINDSLFDKEFTEKSDQLIFTMIIEGVQGNNSVKEIVYKQELYTKLLEYSHSELIEDFKLIQNKDTVKCSLIHLEPANSLDPRLRISFAFRNSNARGEKNYTLLFDDNLFNNGVIKFNYDKEVFNDLPKLKL